MLGGRLFKGGVCFEITDNSYTVNRFLNIMYFKDSNVSYFAEIES